MNKDIPDPTVDWDNIQYNVKSDAIRVAKGFRMCTKCGNTLAVNSHNFARDLSKADGYCYQCKECQRNMRKQKKLRK